MSRADGILHLKLPREFFDQIAQGTKTVEYRRRSRHWNAQLKNATYKTIRFRSRYSQAAPEMDAKCLGIDRGWFKYAIRLGKILDIER